MSFRGVFVLMLIWILVLTVWVFTLEHAGNISEEDFVKLKARIVQP